MTITVASSDASTLSNLTTIGRVKDELGVSSTSDDSMLTEMVKRASDRIRTHCGRKFAKEVVTETFGSRGGTRIVVTRTPLLSISYIEEDGSSVSSTSYEIEDPNAGFIWREDGFGHTIMEKSHITRWPSRDSRKDWTVKYTAGYELPGTTGTRTLPYDVEQACIEMVKEEYIRRKEDPSVRRQRVGDAEEHRYAENPGITPTVLKLLEPWRRFDVSEDN